MSHATPNDDFSPHAQRRGAERGTRRSSRLFQRMADPSPFTDKELDELEKLWAEILATYGFHDAGVYRQRRALVIDIQGQGTLKTTARGVELDGGLERNDDAIRASLELIKWRWPRGREWLAGPIGLDGDDDFKLRTWAQAQILGLHVKAFKPTAEQRDHLLASRTIEINFQDEGQDERQRRQLRTQIEQWVDAKLSGRKIKGFRPSSAQLAQVRIYFGPHEASPMPDRRDRPRASVRRAPVQ